MRIAFFIVAVVLSSFSSAEGDESPVSVAWFENILKDYLYQKYDDFQVAKIYSKGQEPKIFLSAGLGKSVTKDAIDVQSQEFYFREITGKSDSHVGVAIIEYSHPGQAKAAAGSTDKAGYFENSIILTKYILLTQGNRNCVVYTESANDPTAVGLLAVLKGRVR